MGNLGIRTVEYSHSELYDLFVVTGKGMSVISYISFKDSSPIFFFFLIHFLSTKLGLLETWLPTQKILPSHFCRINFDIRSNVGIMAGNQDRVNQYESYNCIIRG